MDEAERDLKALSFGEVADHYGRGRPGYPHEAIRWLIGQDRANVIDLAAGTGKLTRQLAGLGHQVVAVEPSAPMIERLRETRGIVGAVRGAAEAIPLKNDWADAITAAQAFHWFDLDQALPDIHRVLRSGGLLGLLWNLRDESVGWVRELSSVIGSNDAQVSGVADSERFGFDPSHGQITSSGLFDEIEHRVFEHEQVLDLEGLLSLVQSRSNVVTLPVERQQEVVEWVEKLWRDHPDLRAQDSFTLPYRTHAFRTHALDDDG